MSQNESMRVLVRIRPPIYQEVQEKTAVHVTGQNSVSLHSERHDVKCSYHRVFDETSSQDHLFGEVMPILRDVLSGINACIFAYGQTSAGKSFTMLGPDGGQDVMSMDKAVWGLIPRVSEYLLGELADAASDGRLSYQVKASFLQIYNENLYDLLHDSTSKIDDDPESRKNTSDNLKIREIPRPGARNIDSSKNRCQDCYEVYVSGLSEYRVQTCEDVLRIVAAGTSNRTTRSTNYNLTSSRSHAILQLTFDVERFEESGETIIYRSKLSLVDLAGSEKMQTMNVDPTKQHVKELTSINKSLSSLGNVISALSSSNRTHVPYRDSKLTRLLQDSLGGNTRTILIACVAPTVLHASESTSTLQFADRAKNVMSKVRANAIVDGKELLSRAEQEIVRLKSLLQQYMKDGTQSEMNRLIEENEQLKRENIELKLQLHIKQNQKTVENDNGRNTSVAKSAVSDDESVANVSNGMRKGTNNSSGLKNRKKKNDMDKNEMPGGKKKGNSRINSTFGKENAEKVDPSFDNMKNVKCGVDDDSFHIKLPSYGGTSLGSDRPVIPPKIGQSLRSTSFNDNDSRLNEERVDSSKFRAVGISSSPANPFMSGNEYGSFHNNNNNSNVGSSLQSSQLEKLAHEKASTKSRLDQIIHRGLSSYLERQGIAISSGEEGELSIMDSLSNVPKSKKDLELKRLRARLESVQPRNKDVQRAHKELNVASNTINRELHEQETHLQDIVNMKSALQEELRRLQSEDNMMLKKEEEMLKTLQDHNSTVLNEENMLKKGGNDSHLKNPSIVIEESDDTYEEDFIEESLDSSTGSWKTLGGSQAVGNGDNINSVDGRSIGSVHSLRQSIAEASNSQALSYSPVSAHSSSNAAFDFSSENLGPASSVSSISRSSNIVPSTFDVHNSPPAPPPPLAKVLSANLDPTRLPKEFIREEFVEELRDGASHPPQAAIIRKFRGSSSKGFGREDSKGSLQIDNTDLDVGADELVPPKRWGSVSKEAIQSAIEGAGLSNASARMKSSTTHVGLDGTDYSTAAFVKSVSSKGWPIQEEDNMLPQSRKNNDASTSKLSGAMSCTDTEVRTNDSNIVIPANLSYTSNDISRDIQIFSFRLNQWETVKLEDFDSNRGCHKCKFPNETSQWLDLKRKPIRSVPLDGDRDKER